jgi:hypothetical protein
MKLTGTIEAIMLTQQISDKFKKREFVVEIADNPQYPESIKIEVIQDKCDDLQGYNIGDSVEVDINLKGRKWDDPNGGVKYFNTLQAWRIKGHQPPQPQTQPQPQQNDNLPF